MDDSEEILISVHPKYVDSMIRGSKTVELRRRPFNVSAGCRVWIYSTRPRGSLEAVGIVQRVAVATPRKIWRSHGKKCGISKQEFDAYFSGSEKAYAVIFSEILPLPLNIDLEDIRRKVHKFHPPQFFKRLISGCPELKLFESTLHTAFAA